MSLPTSYTLQIKRVFLNFLQQYFANCTESRYRWSSDYRITNLIVADKNGIDRPINEKRPLIVLSRQTVRPTFSTIKQRLAVNFRNNQTAYMDLLEGSVAINCLSKSGVQAEELAHIVMLAILSFRDHLKGYNGIHQLTDLRIGEETNVLVDVNTTLVNVPVVVRFTKNIGWTPGPILSSVGQLDYILSGVTYSVYEGLHYDVFRNRITMETAIPSGSTASVTYIHNTTLASVTETIWSEGASGIDGINKVHLLSNPVYAYYPVVRTISVSGIVSGLTYYFPPAYPSGIRYDTYMASGVVYRSGEINTTPTASGWFVTTSGFSGML